MKSWRPRTFVIIVIVIVVAWLLLPRILSSDGSGGTTEPPKCSYVSSAVISFTEVVSLVKEGKVSCAVVQGNNVSIKLVDESHNLVKVTPTKDFIEMLRFYGVTAEDISKIDYYPGGSPPESFLSFLPLIFILALVGFVVWNVRRSMKAQQQGSGGREIQDKSKRDPANSPESKGGPPETNNQERITFEDVAGVDEAKKELQEQVEFLKNPGKFASSGARMPTGVLLVGPPGTGKTLLARAVAGEAGVPFFSMNGSEFIELYVGVGARRVRDLFDTARKNSPCVVFIDEIDSIGKKRTSGLGSGGEGEQHQTINQLLAVMDGFDKNTGIIVLAATNRVDVLDAALLRPGRFTRHIIVDRPDLKGREAILKIHLRDKKLEKGITVLSIAKRTPGFTGADLANILNEAAIFAVRRDSATISNQDINNAIDRIIAGSENKTLLLSEEEKNIIAHHECGHAVVRYLASNGSMIPNKISIVSRGSALGLTWYIPDRDVVLQRRSELKFELAGTIGGYVAEDILLRGDITTGPSSDLEKLTDLARRMITKYAMSDKLPTRLFIQDGQSLVSTDSQETKARVDSEIEALVAEAKSTAQTIIEENRKGFLGLVNQLRKEEVIADEQLLEAFIYHFPDHEASQKAREKLAQIRASNEEQAAKEQ